MSEIQRAVGRDLCEALGLEPRQVVGVTLRIRANQPVIAEVEYLPTKEQAAAAVAVLKASQDAVEVKASDQAEGTNEIVIVNNTGRAMDAVVDAMRDHGGRLRVLLRDAMRSR